ncbi:MAG: MotA/TolQ/ExbB proton channel family protein [Thioalkalivibrionaceae bacterium]
MLDIIVAGGWLMAPILVASALALAIIIERLFSLRRGRIVPEGLLDRTWDQIATHGLTAEAMHQLRHDSPLGRILATGLAAHNQSREVMKASIEDTGRHVAHELERFLPTLGTIAAVTPLLGLLGTVVGMIEVFAVITEAGVGSPRDLAGGISTALITTAAGISVAIPALVFHRYFRGLVDSLVLDMEREALRLVEAVYGDVGHDQASVDSKAGAQR